MHCLCSDEIEKIEKLNEERRKPESNVKMEDLFNHYQEVCSASNSSN